MARILVAMLGSGLLLLGLNTTTASVVIEVPLPELAGDYDSSTGEMVIYFDLGGPVDVVNGVSIHLVGSITYGIHIYNGEEYPWCGEFIATFMDPYPSFWMAGTFTEGKFDEILPFSSLFGATWDFLYDGQGSMNFGFAPCPIIGIMRNVEPTGTISEATLLFDVLLATRVPLPPVEPATISTIKALY